MSHVESRQGISALRLAFFATVALIAVEVGGGLLSGSLALLSDAAHMLTDVAALGLAWWAAALAQRPADQRLTFGYRRAGVLAALVNGALLVVVVIALAAAAVWRLATPQTVLPLPMGLAALVALAVNSALAWRLGHFGSDLNLRGAWLHVMGDAAASLGVVVTAVALGLTGVRWLDPVASLFISGLVAVSAWRVIRHALGILMEAVPAGMDAGAVAAGLKEVVGVESVHDVHLWCLDPHHVALSAHLLVPDQSLAQAATVRADAANLLLSRFGITHATLELECSNCSVGGDEVSGPYCEPALRRA